MAPKQHFNIEKLSIAVAEAKGNNCEGRGSSGVLLASSAVLCTVPSTRMLGFSICSVVYGYATDQTHARKAETSWNDQNKSLPRWEIFFS